MKKSVYVTAFLAVMLSFGMLMGGGCTVATSSDSGESVPDAPAPDVPAPEGPASGKNETEPVAPAVIVEEETPSAARTFVFGTAAGSGNATRVDSDAAYSDSVGYGFDGTVTVGENTVTGSNFQFCAKVNNGNYKVTVVTSATTVLSEVLPESITYTDASGNTAVYKCPHITGIERGVTANTASTFSVAVCDGVMNLKFIGENVSVSSVLYEPIFLTARAKPYLIAIGDSTAYINDSKKKQCAWGPCIAKKYVQLPSEIDGFVNCALGGADAITIYNGGVHKGTKWGITEALLNVRPGDYVTVNIGINNNQKFDLAGQKDIVSDSRNAQLPVFEKYAVEGILQRGGIPVIATITPYGDEGLFYAADTKVPADTYAGGKLYKAGATVPAGTWHNSRHDNQFNKNLLTIADIYGIQVIDLGMYGEQFLTENKVTTADIKTTWYSDNNHYQRAFGEVLANYITKSVVEMMNCTYVNPYSEELLAANAVAASADEGGAGGNSGSTVQPAAERTVPKGFTEIFKEDYSSATAETCGWNGFLGKHDVARGKINVTDGYVTLSGSEDKSANGVFFASYAGGKSSLPTVADGKDFYVSFDIQFCNGNKSSSTFVLSNAAGSGLDLGKSPQWGNVNLANCLLLLRQTAANGDTWKVFDSDAITVKLNLMSWYTFAVSRIDSATHLVITERDSGKIVIDDYVENSATTKGGFGEIQLATGVVKDKTSFCFDSFILGEGSNNGKVPGMKTVSHSVTFDANGGIITASTKKQTVTITKFEDEEITEAELTKPLTSAEVLGLQRASYDFVGWATSASATTATYTDGQSVAITSDMTLYAVWEYDDMTALLDIASVNTGTASSFSKQIQIDTQDAAVRDGIVNADYDVDETALQAKLDEFDAENDVQPYIIARAKTKTDASGAVTQKWVLIYGAAAGSKSGQTLYIPAGYNANNSFDVINYALSQLPAKRSEKYKLLIDSDVYSGESSNAKNSFPQATAYIYAIDVPSYTILDFNGHALVGNNSNPGGVVPLSMARAKCISVRNLTIKGVGRYGIWCQACDNVVFDTINMELTNCGVGLRIADRLVDEWSYNVYVDNIKATGGKDNIVETNYVDGIYVGTIEATDVPDCALLFNRTTNGIVGTVRGTRCSPRSSNGVYAAFRCANYVGPNIHVHNVIANSCGRGFFSVSANHDITIDYLESNDSYKQAALIQDTQNLVIKSGKLTATKRGQGGPAIEFGKDSKGGPLTVMNNVIKNVTISGYDKIVTCSSSDYLTFINCNAGKDISLGGTHSKVVASEAALAANTTADSVA
nr:InlB B-repeat-containing protein [Treponema sp.]